MNQGEVAKILGISKTTVSRAVSGKGRVSEDTRNRVLELLNKSQIKTPKQGEATKNICVAIPGEEMISSNTYFSEVLFGVCEALSINDYNVIVVKSTDTDISEIKRVVEEHKADGIILTRSLEHDAALEYLSSINFPVAVAGHTHYNNVMCVDIDNEKASEELTMLMIAKGYKRFTCIVEDMNYVVNKSRLDGFLRAIEKKELPLDRQYIYTGAFNPDLLHVISGNVLSKKTECIICGDDEIAVKVMSWLKNEGYRIPTDVAIASCYNSYTLNVLVPAITAVDASARNVGSMLGKQMINLIEKKPYQMKFDVDYDILLRKSTNKLN